MSKEFFPQRLEVKPTIYAYELVNVPTHRGLLKVGYTTRDARERIREQVGTAGVQYQIVLEKPAMRHDGTVFTDHEVHHMLRLNGIQKDQGEWFHCTIKDVEAAIRAVKNGQLNIENRSIDFKMRPEQEAAVEKTAEYFLNWRKDKSNHNKPAHFLWNCKMRFGKTFAAYQLAKKMGWQKVLIMTFKPAVQSAWEEDLLSHVDFEGWQFIKPGGLTYEEADKTKPIVCFGSFQDYLGRNPSTGGIKTKNEWVHATNWDCVIFDEYHYGAWRESAKISSKQRRKRQNIGKARRWRTLMRTFFPSPLTTTSTFPARHFVRLRRASLLRSRSTTGPTPMSSVRKKAGRHRIILMLPCRAWYS